MLREYFEQLQIGVEASLREHPEIAGPRKRYALEVARLGSRLYGGGESVAWCGVAAPFDVLNAMGTASCFVEFVGAMLASTGAVAPMLAEAERAGYATDTCAYHRAVIGAARRGMMPVPDFLVATTCPCTAGVATLENLARYFGKDLFVLQIPQEETPESVEYLARRIREMSDFVARHTGRALDPAGLRQAMELTNQARETLVEVFRLARKVPSPASGREMGNLGVVLPLFLGTPAADEVARAYREALEARVRGGIQGVPGERFRLLWIQNRIQFKEPLVRMLEQEYGANIVADELNAVTWDPVDPDDPFPGLARRAISIPLNGPIRRRILHLQRLARSYRVHGAINPCHWGCRQGSGARGLIEAGLKEIGVPVLNLEVDCVDAGNFAEGQLRTRLQAFLEMLGDRPPRAGEEAP